MPAAHPMGMDCAAMAAPACDHMKGGMDQGNPCKNMGICFGLWACYGLAALGDRSQR